MNEPLNMQFYWGTKASEEESNRALAQKLIDAAVAGGMPREEAVSSFEHLWSIAWGEGGADECYNNTDFSGN